MPDLLTADILLKVMPNVKTRIDSKNPKSKTRLEVFLEPLNITLEAFEINTPRRAAMFLAQVAHESGEFRYLAELADGVAYDTGKLAENLGNTPGADGDGQKYRGRGLIQITGAANYKECSIALFRDPDFLLTNPEVLEKPLHACRSAGWFWKWKKLNACADADDFLKCTKIINGGTNGLDDRKMYWERAKRELKVT